MSYNVYHILLDQSMLHTSLCIDNYHPFGTATAADDFAKATHMQNRHTDLNTENGQVQWCTALKSTVRCVDVSTCVAPDITAASTPHPPRLLHVI